MQAQDFGSLLKRASGLDLASLGQATVDRALQQRLDACGLDSLEAYWDRVQQDAEELEALIEAVVVPETWFFRNPEALQMMVSRISSLEPDADSPASLLSLPCSTGEEPYSMSMALLEEGVAANTFRIQAVDISQQALRKAEKGFYGANSFRGAALAFRDRYFREQEEGWLIEPHVREPVRFLQSNLFDDALQSRLERYDIIFCRNLLIYFAPHDQYQAIQILGSLMKPDGLLFVGPAEAGVLLKYDWISQRIPHTFAFRQPRPDISSKDATPAAASRRPEPLATPSARRPIVTAPVSRSQAPSPLVPDSAESAADVLRRARQLADGGQLAEAEQLTKQYLQQHGPQAEAYYLLGLVDDAAGKTATAHSHYRKALYLDPRHQGAMVHLAMLLEARGEHTEADRLRQRARRIDTSDPDTNR